MTSLDAQRAALRRLARGVTSHADDVSPLIRRGTRILLVAIWVLAIAASIGSGLVMVSHGRSHTMAAAISLEQYTRRNVGVAAFVADEFEEFVAARGGIDNIAQDDVARYKLQALISRLPEDSSALLVRPDGSIAMATEALPKGPLNLADRRWFRAHMDENRDSYVGPAIRSRVSDRYLYTYSAAYRSDDGRIVALIDLGIPTGSITGLTPVFTAAELALVQHDGAVVAANPFHPQMIDQPFALPGTPPLHEATQLAWSHGRLAIVSLRDLPDLGLYAVVSLPLAVVLQPLLWSVAAGLPLLLLLSYFLMALSHQLQKKSSEVEQALADNKVLFQEVHHRVKNNLQVVSSLLRLQTERVPPELRPVLEETGARVRAIALVHEQIYRTASPSDVQLDRFLAQLVQQLAASMMSGTARITTSLEPVTIGLDRAVPVAILATEAITNAIKHGLAGGAGEIGVSLARADGRIVLEVRDSGSGPVEQGKAGLGTRIMTALSRQIDGAWTLRTTAAGGTVFSLSWPA